MTEKIAIVAKEIRDLTLQLNLALERAENYGLMIDIDIEYDTMGIVGDKRLQKRLDIILSKEIE